MTGMTTGKHATEEKRRIAEAHTILRCQVGSGVHGTAVSGTDDRDGKSGRLFPREARTFVWPIVSAVPRPLGAIARAAKRLKVPWPVRAPLGDRNNMILRQYALGRDGVATQALVPVECGVQKALAPLPSGWKFSMTAWWALRATSRCLSGLAS